MKRIILYFLILISFSFCNKEYTARKTVTVAIEKFKMDSTSIRAIEIVNDSTIVYAGSIGDLGIITGSGKLKATKKIKTDSIVPHFRALAYTNKAIYALAVGNPALLYKYKNDSIEIVYKEEHEKVFYDAMQFFDELNGIAIGDPTDNCLSILITRNGGETWGKIPCENIPAIEKGEAAFAASNTNIAIVGENAWIVTGGTKARVFHTSNMGLTWQVYTTPIVQGKEATGIYSVAFFNEYEGIICGGDYTNKFGKTANKAITKDGGETWTVVAENNDPTYVSCVQYVPNTNGKELFAVSTNGIYYSSNSGENWVKVANEGYYSIRIVNKNTAWLSGDEKISKMTIQ